ncbi:DUF3108 domain-containing protein [Ramlibacter rhizophilus]|uniref:DUF3108 domain-containing protein n=1 Tax=Ramlibacter rhizophilus TaxID=1781167 RepID=A0A4Z0BFP0_9BURK|nr:DUF3108 domain-containing protein [Ramlibacter rhizophilus]TFY97501.1 DUF3108 domain-containing protein [Ramlibacter rhizophilus]
MARRQAPRLRPARVRPAVLLVVAVLLLHLAALEWLARRHLQPPSALSQIAEPLFTRLLAPAAPPPPAPGTPAPALARVERPTITALPPEAPPVPAPSPPAPAPEPPAPPAREPEPEPESVAAAQQQQEAPPAEEAPEPRADAGAAVEPPLPAQEAAQPPAPDTATASSEEAPRADAAGTEPAPAPAPAQAEAAPDPQAAGGTDTASPDRWPGDSRLGYELTGQYRGGPLHGSAQVQWQRQGVLYQVRVSIHINLVGSRVLTSQGLVRPEGLEPRVYEETWRGKRRSVRLQDGRVLFTDGSSAEMPPGVQDTASQFVELGHRFASGREALRVGGTAEVWLARPGGVDLWTYDVVESERLTTRAHGEVEAFRLKPRPLSKPRGNITAEIWIAPTLQYLPVRIRVNVGEEDFVDLMVETIEQR